MEVSVLQRGDAVPHFEVRIVDGEVFSYSSIWQRRNLVLAILPSADRDGEYARALMAERQEFRNRESACVVTQECVPGLPAPGVLVADRWGEIVHAETVAEVGDLPTVRDLLDWVEYLEHRCPECEGEAR